MTKPCTFSFSNYSVRAFRKGEIELINLERYSDDVLVVEKRFPFKENPSKAELKAILTSTEEWFVFGLLSFSIGYQLDCFYEMILDPKGSRRAEHDYGARLDAEKRTSLCRGKEHLAEFMRTALDRFRQLPESTQSRVARALSFYSRGFRKFLNLSNMAEIYLVQYTAFEILLSCAFERFPELEIPIVSDETWGTLMAKWTQDIEETVEDPSKRQQIMAKLPHDASPSRMHKARELIDRLELDVDPGLVRKLISVRSKIVHEGILPKQKDLPGDFVGIIRNAVDRLVLIALRYDNKFSRRRWVTRSYSSIDILS